MAYNLKAGVMATTTMVGSVVAYTKTQAGGEDQSGANNRNQNTSLDTATYSGDGFGGNKSSTSRTSKQYKDTFDQMMIWKY